MTHHALTIVNRSKRDGVRHRHNWQPECVCGWYGIPIRNKNSAVTAYRVHVLKATNGARTTARPRKVTPNHLLPDAFRSP